MKQITIHTEIHCFDEFKEFVDAFEVGKGDLIFTRKGFLPFFEKLKNTPQFLFNDDYGKGEPTDVIIDRILNDVKKRTFTRLIAIGGGSVIDIAKLLVLKDVTSTAALFQKEIPAIKAKELIAIPTTCGTGSEVTNVSITAVEALSTKLGLADRALFPDHAVLIPELLKDLPYSVIINSSVDALVHGAESFLSPKATPFSRMYSKEAMTVIVGVFSKAAREGKETVHTQIKDLLMASCYAGLAFGHAGTAIVHAMAYPLGSAYHVPHGEANYQFFIPCFKHYMKQKPEGAIKEISALFAGCLDCPEEESFDRLQEVLSQLLPLKDLRAYGMKEEECISFAESVLKNQQRLLVNSYVQFNQEVIEAVYRLRY